LSVSRLAASAALEQDRKAVGGNADSPAGKHPDEPEIVRVAVKIERGEKANHRDVDAEVDEKSPHGVILGHGCNS
jgi:hypothetical protein